MHLDIAVADFDRAEQQLVALGATKIGGGDGWVVFADPVGHPFCLGSS
jgi:hypothetical protein